MRARFGDHFLAGLRVQPDGDLVAHGAGGHKQRSLAANNMRRMALEQIDSRVFAVNVSPTSAAAMAARISGVGRVTVSERRSMIVANGCAFLKSRKSRPLRPGVLSYLLIPVPAFYGIFAIGSSITGVRWPLFTAYAHRP
jgi:hypothetical protein